MIRDLLLLPLILLFSRQVVLHFHAAGIADQLEAGGIIARLTRVIYSKAFAAIVMTEFGLRDPRGRRYQSNFRYPWRISRRFRSDVGASRRRWSVVRLLHMGHLCADKGTPQLLAAFAALRRDHPELELELVGECLPPFTSELLEKTNRSSSAFAPRSRFGPFHWTRQSGSVWSRRPFCFPDDRALRIVWTCPGRSDGLEIADRRQQWRGNSDVLTSACGRDPFSGFFFPCRGISRRLWRKLWRSAPNGRNGARSIARFSKSAIGKNGAEHWLLDPLLSLIEPAGRDARRILYVHNSADIYGASRSLARLLRGSGIAARQCSGGDSRGWTLCGDDRKLGQSDCRSIAGHHLALRLLDWHSCLPVATFGPAAVQAHPKGKYRSGAYQHRSHSQPRAGGQAGRRSACLAHSRIVPRRRAPWLWKIYSRYIRMVARQNYCGLECHCCAIFRSQQSSRHSQWLFAR